MSFAPLLPNSIVLPINPRTQLNKRPFPAQRMVDYLKVAYDVHTNKGLRLARREHVTDDVGDLLPNALNFDLLLYQNLDDHLYLTRQVVPFIERYRTDPCLYVRFERDGKGHVPIPRPTLDGIVASLAVETRRQQVIRSAGFNQATLVPLPITTTVAPVS